MSADLRRLCELRSTKRSARWSGRLRDSSLLASTVVSPCAPDKFLLRPPRNERLASAISRSELAVSENQPERHRRPARRAASRPGIAEPSVHALRQIDVEAVRYFPWRTLLNARCGSVGTLLPL
jgi:hypothetical protein